jgi:hypothetical protein
MQVQLNNPVTYNDKTYAAIDVSEPTVAAIEAYQQAIANGKTEIGATIEMLSVDTGVPVDVFRKMKMSDMTRISEALAPFAAAQDSGQPGEPSAQTLPTS